MGYGFGYTYSKITPRLKELSSPFIEAHEAATGVSMNITQQSAVIGLIDRLKGNGTTNNSDVWSLAQNNNARMWIFAPSNDTTISFEGCNVELFSASTIGTFNNYISSDLNTTGLIGGTGKYFDSDTPMDIYPVDDYSFGAYSQTDSLDSGYDFYADLNCMVRFRDTVDRSSITMNATGLTTNGVGTSLGLLQGTRNDVITKYIRNGVVIDTTGTSIINSPMTSNNGQFSARLPTGKFSNRRYSIFFMGLQYMDSNTAADFYEAIQWYQTNIITGGRNV